MVGMVSKHNGSTPNKVSIHSLREQTMSPAKNKQEKNDAEVASKTYYYTLFPFPECLSNSMT